MGRFTKKTIVFYCVLIAAWMPLSVVAASVDCLFHDRVDINSSIEHDSHSSHSSAIDLSDVDFSDIQVSDNNDYGPDNTCSTQLIAAAVSEVQVFCGANWKKTGVQFRDIYKLTTVSLPADIRPPISA
ncbi:MAG: hypothetical protein OEZ43_12300 [Gammaproteobacteria bacterium]|nr:hypothetical protein [Gammaproteobacteria bacterium]